MLLLVLVTLVGWARVRRQVVGVGMIEVGKMGN